MSQEQTPQQQDDKGGLRVLVVVDESALGAHTARIGAAVAASMAAEAVFHFPMPIEPVDADSPAQLARALPEYHEACRERARVVFEAACDAAARVGARCRTELTIDEVPADAVRRVAQENDCRIIVVGSLGRGRVSRVLHGSLADELVQVSDRPVLVCREDMGFGSIAALPPT
jgi:nucleotide-binding universal stress UspA family protein